MELEEAFEEYGSEDATSEFNHSEKKSSFSEDPYSDINTRNIGMLKARINADDPSNTKKVRLNIRGDNGKQIYSIDKYKKVDTMYKRYIEIDEENVDDPLWSPTVKPFDSTMFEKDSVDIFDIDEGGPFEHLRLSFLEKFDDLPEIDDISSTLSEEIIMQPMEEEWADMTLLGKFVDPLTGVELRNTYQSVQIEYEYEYVDNGEEEEGQYQRGSRESLEISEDSELLELDELEADLDKIEETKTGLVQPDDDIPDFEIATKTMEIESVPFDEALAEDTKRQFIAIVEAFVEDLMQLVVEASEYKDPREVLRKTINKKKLMEEIEVKLRQLEVEQNVRMYLNRKVVEHHKRKRMYRAIIEDSPETTEYFMQRYKEQLDKYDEVMGKEVELTTTMNRKTNELKAKLEENERKVQEKIDEFEDIVKKTLLRGQEVVVSVPKGKKESLGRVGKVDIAKTISILLNKFNAARKDISETRLDLIRKQHLYAELKERLASVQYIGNGLSLTHYEQLLNEVKQLNKKTEDRNFELIKARNHRVLNVHISTHMKESTLMLRNALEVKKMSYRELLREYEEARLHAFKQKRIRAQIRKEIKECYYQGGILSKPALMLDYDRTEDEVRSKEFSIASLRNRIRTLSDKIAQFETRLSASFTNKS